VGLEQHADKRVSDYSKGMKIRLNVARSLLHKPKLLFLDEPTSGLDPVNARRIKELICRVREGGTTVFVTTHNMGVADELCDRVAFISGGGIAALDAPATLKKRYGERLVVVEYRALDTPTLQSRTFPLDDLGAGSEFAALMAQGHRVETLHSQETTLENVFIKVTGEALRA